MSEQTKKILLISAFVLIAGGASYLLWLMFTDSTKFDKNPNEQVVVSGNLPASGPNTGIVPVTPGIDNNLPVDEAGETPESPTKPSGRDNKISSPNNFPILDASLDSSGSTVQYYDPLDKKFYRLDDNGAPQAISDKPFYKVDKVSWSPDRNKAILEYPDGSKNIYNFSDQSQVSLPKHWQDFQFSPSGEQIAFKAIGYEPENRWLSIMNADGTGAQNIEKLGANADKATVNWSPNRQIVATFQDGADYNRQEVFFIGTNHENFKSMLVEGRGFQSKWSTTGNELLYSVYSDFNNYKPSLWITNANGDTIGQDTEPLQIDTWASKCSFASDKLLYCAVPRSLADGAGWLPPETLDTPDDVYAIDLETMAKSLVIAEGNYNMSNLIITKDGNTLYFTDNKTGGLYKLPLK
jgi:hypothetical protein